MMALVFVGTWPTDLQEAGERVYAAFKAAIAASDVPEGAVNVKLVDDAESKALNETYNGNAYATDVLTFHYAESGDLPDSADGEIADIAISVETARRQAAEAGTSLPDEIGLLLVHGLLHVIGHDHQDESARQRVDSLQSDIIAQAGLTYRDMRWTQ